MSNVETRSNSLLRSIIFGTMLLTSTSIFMHEALADASLSTSFEDESGAWIDDEGRSEGNGGDNASWNGVSAENGNHDDDGAEGCDDESDLARC